MSMDKADKWTKNERYKKVIIQFLQATLELNSNFFTLSPSLFDLLIYLDYIRNLSLIDIDFSHLNSSTSSNC